MTRAAAPLASVAAAPSRRGLWAGIGVAATVALTALGGAAPTAALAADDCANAEFRTGWSAKLPDCRAYELVGPKQDGGYSPDTRHVGNNPTPVGVTQSQYRRGMLLGPDGSGFVITLGGIPAYGDGLSSPYNDRLFRRTASGWDFTPRSYPMCGQVGGYVSGWAGRAYSEDFGWSIGFLMPDQNGVARSCDALSEEAQPDSSWLVDAAGNLRGRLIPAGAKQSVASSRLSADGSLALFSTDGVLAPTVETRAAGTRSVYVRTAAAGVRPIALDSDGTSINPCGAIPVIASESGDANYGSQDSTWPISRDNRVVFFYSGLSTSIPGCSVVNDGAGQLYARIDPTSDSAKTVLISPVLPGAPSGTRTVPRFLGASESGRKAYFGSEQALVPGATAGGLYEYDLGPVLDGDASVGTLRLVSGVVGSGTAQISSLIDMTTDGAVLFVASGNLVPGTVPSGAKLYRAIDGQVELITGMTRPPSPATVRVSENGRWIVYHANGPGGQLQIYRVDLHGDRTPVCVSCPPSGVAPTRPAAFENYSDGYNRQFGVVVRSVVNDGRVVFASPDRLSVDDADDFDDVYMYTNGERQLLSPGTETSHALLMLVDARNDFRSIAFATADSLLPSDTDNGNLDIYVARVGGGFPQPEPDRPACAGDGCQGNPQGGLVGTVGGSAMLHGPGNLLAPVEKSSPRARVSLVKGSRSVRGTSGSVRVKVSEKGRVRSSGSGLRRSYVSAKKAQTLRVPVRLSQRAQRRLAKRGSVRVSVTVRFSPDRGSARSVRTRMTFRRAAKKAKKASTRTVASAAGGRAVR